MNLKNLVTPFKVGLVVLLAILVGVYMVGVVTQGEGWGSPEGYRVYATFSDVTGLAENSRVMMAGIPVGHIDDIQLVEGGRAKVWIYMQQDVKLQRGVQTEDGDYWRNGATVTKKQASLIGDYYLEVTPGTEGPELSDGDEIKNVPPTIGPDELFERFDRIAGNIEELTASLSDVFGGPEGRQAMRSMLEDLQRILQTVRQFVETNQAKMDRVLANASNISEEINQFTTQGTDSLEQILADAQTITEEVKFMVGQSSGDVQAGLGTLRGTLGRLQSTLDSLNYSLQNVQDITDKVNEGEGTIGSLVNDPTISNRTEQILNDAGDLVGRVSNLRTIVNLRTEYHFRHERVKNVVGLKLQPTPLKYYLLEFVDDFRGKTDVLTRDVNTTRADAEDGLYRKTVVTTKDEFKLSLQIARGVRLTDWLALTGRFGVIESTGGLGGDILMTEDNDVKISTDIYDFGVDANPRLRSYASFEILEYAYIMGGIDDALNANRRDYFLGAGLEFNDEDLKALLTMTGVPTSGP